MTLFNRRLCTWTLYLLFLLPLSYLPHNEPDYRHILRSICRIVAIISVRRLDANRSTQNPYSRVMENGADWSSVTHQMSNTELISPGQVSASEVPPLQKVVQTITRLIKMHYMTANVYNLITNWTVWPWPWCQLTRFIERVVNVTDKVVCILLLHISVLKNLTMTAFPAIWILVYCNGNHRQINESIVCFLHKKLTH